MKSRRLYFFFFSSKRRHTRLQGDWSSDVCSSDLADGFEAASETTLHDEGIPVERLAPAEIEARWPQIGLDGVVFAVHEPEAGLLLARQGVAAVAQAFGREGGHFE